MAQLQRQFLFCLREACLCPLFTQATDDSSGYMVAAHVHQLMEYTIVVCRTAYYLLSITLLCIPHVLVQSGYDFSSLEKVTTKTFVRDFVSNCQSKNKTRCQQ